LSRRQPTAAVPRLR